MIALAAAVIAAALGSCGGSHEPASTGGEVDSTFRFHGAKRGIARVVEDYEAAIRVGDTTTLCRKVLQIGGEHLNRAQTRRCIRDLSGETLPHSARAGTLDLAVRRIELVPQRPRDFPAAVRRYQIEWALEDAPSAVALVARADRKAGRLTAFSLGRLAGEWRIADRGPAREIDPVGGPHARARLFRRHGLLGLLGIATAGRNLDCRGEREALLDLFAGAQSPNARNARQAVLRSELVGSAVRRLVREGGSLREVHVGYGPQLERTFALRRASGRTVAQIPMIGAHSSGYYIQAISGCPAWIDRVANRIVGNGAKHGGSER